MRVFRFALTGIEVIDQNTWVILGNVSIIEVTRSKQEAPGTLGWLIDKVYCTHTWKKKERKNDFWNVTNVEHTDKIFGGLDYI